MRRFAMTDQSVGSGPAPDDGERYEDFGLPGSMARLDVEAAYRRGYQQGASVAAEALRRGAALSAMIRWATEGLHSWRYDWREPDWTRGRMVKVVAPPEPPTPKGREMR
jgi:hypothetical protein